MVANETTVLVPVDNVDGVGLRRAINDEEIERLFSLLGDGKIDSHQNWKGRFKDNSDRMRTGSIYDVVEVLKSLTFLARSKNLSFREKRMLDRAKFLVVSEISRSPRDHGGDFEEKVDRALDRCFTTKNRRLPAPGGGEATATTRVTARRTAKASYHSVPAHKGTGSFSKPKSPSFLFMLVAIRSIATTLQWRLRLLIGPRSSSSRSSLAGKRSCIVSRTWASAWACS